MSTILSVMACPVLVSSLLQCVRWRESRWREKWTSSRLSKPWGRRGLTWSTTRYAPSDGHIWPSCAKCYCYTCRHFMSTFWCLAMSIWHFIRCFSDIVLLIRNIKRLSEDHNYVIACIKKILSKNKIYICLTMTQCQKMLYRIELNVSE